MDDTEGVVVCMLEWQSEGALEVRSQRGHAFALEDYRISSASCFWYLVKLTLGLY